MESHIPIYRLKSGHISLNGTLKIEFIFGLIFSDDGNLYIELHFDETLDLELFYLNNEHIFQRGEHELICSTEDGYKLTATRVSIKSFPFHMSKCDLYCFGHILIEKKVYEVHNSSNQIRYVKLEGLRMKHTDLTYVETIRTYGTLPKEKPDSTQKRDHSTIILNLDSKSYKLIIRDHIDGESIVEFLNEKDGYSSMLYDLWESIRLDFLHFLSFLNGAAIYIRAEYYGQYHTIGKLDAQIKKIHSIKKNSPIRWNDFIPINNSSYTNLRLVSYAFLTCFENYRKRNTQFDLNTIIFYLNNSEQSTSMGERIYIQTILLEKFSDKHAEMFDTDVTTIIDPILFDPILDELKNVIRKHRRTLGDSINLINSRLTNLNRTKRKQTDFKFRELIKATNIELTDEVEKLLISRHQFVHRGDIGESEEAKANYLLMDNLIRKILAKMIGYDNVSINIERLLQNLRNLSDEPNRIDNTNKEP